MPLIIEDGSIVADSNSYADVEQTRAYATARGATLPQDDDDVEILLIKAMDYLETFSARFVGEKASREQTLSWPRSGVAIDGFRYEANEIPKQVLNAQMALALEIHGGEDPFNPSTHLPVVSESVGPVRVQYAAPAQTGKGTKTLPSERLIRALLKPVHNRVVRA